MHCESLLDSFNTLLHDLSFDSQCTFDNIKPTSLLVVTIVAAILPGGNRSLRLIVLWNVVYYQVLNVLIAKQLCIHSGQHSAQVPVSICHIHSPVSAGCESSLPASVTPLASSSPSLCSSAHSLASGCGGGGGASSTTDDSSKSP